MDRIPFDEDGRDVVLAGAGPNRTDMAAPIVTRQDKTRQDKKKKRRTKTDQTSRQPDSRTQKRQQCNAETLLQIHKNVFIFEQK